MNVNIGIGEKRLPNGLPAEVEPNLTDSRPPSVALSDDGTEDLAGELWDELEVVLRAQEDDLVEQDEAALPGTPGPSIDTPATPPLSPMRPIVPELKGEYQPRVSPPRPHVLSPSEGVGVDGQAARTNPARASPSHRFFASPDQIHALGMPRAWVHGQVISTLGDTFCYPSRLKPRHEHYEILPTDLFELWSSYVESQTRLRTRLSYHFKQAASPFVCRAWLVPVLLEFHWYLLAFDWIDRKLHIYDSLATSKVPHQSLVNFGSALLLLITEEFDMEDCEWNVVPEQVSNFHYGLTRF